MTKPYAFSKDSMDIFVALTLLIVLKPNYCIEFANSMVRIRRETPIFKQQRPGLREKTILYSQT